jgi:hypothetical protein
MGTNPGGYKAGDADNPTHPSAVLFLGTNVEPLQGSNTCASNRARFNQFEQS